MPGREKVTHEGGNEKSTQIMERSFTCGPLSSLAGSSLTRTSQLQTNKPNDAAQKDHESRNQNPCSQTLSTRNGKRNLVYQKRKFKPAEVADVADCAAASCSAAVRRGQTPTITVS